MAFSFSWTEMAIADVAVQFQRHKLLYPWHWHPVLFPLLNISLVYIPFQVLKQIDGHFFQLDRNGHSRRSSAVSLIGIKLAYLDELHEMFPLLKSCIGNHHCKYAISTIPNYLSWSVHTLAWQTSFLTSIGVVLPCGSQSLLSVCMTDVLLRTLCSCWKCPWGTHWTSSCEPEESPWSSDTQSL